ncbi:hypothetical protein HDU67_009022 [Dinochytrium kinnereticum]|nr:hypothetical protein HDU67_009022 [Dinochytrium kinnereticum]
MDKIKEQIRNELALANYQDLLQRINGKCFTKCITKPGASLTQSEDGCISKCAAMYIEVSTQNAVDVVCANGLMHFVASLNFIELDSDLEFVIWRLAYYFYKISELRFGKQDLTLEFKMHNVPTTIWRYLECGYSRVQVSMLK